MTLRDEITKLFFNTDHGQIVRRYVESEDYPYCVFKTSDYYGVAIPYDGDAVNEKFTSVNLIDNSSIEAHSKFEFDPDGNNYLLLRCNNMELTKEFSLLCADFVFPDTDGSNRKAIEEDPVSWWQSWKGLLGNISVDYIPYSVIAELFTYTLLLEKGYKVKWAGPDSSSHDILGEVFDIEVKSSCRKYENIVHIAGEYQLEDNGKPLYLCFFKLESSSTGYSIDSLVEILVNTYGISRTELNNQLKRIGYPEGNSSRRQTYVILDMLVFHVDEDFPKITKKNQDKWPQAFSKIEYELNLVDIPCTTIYEYGENKANISIALPIEK